MGDNGEADPIGKYLYDGQAHAVDGDRAFFYAVAHQVRGNGDHQVGNLRHDMADTVDMALHQVASEAILQTQRSFEVDDIAGRQRAQVGALQRFLGQIGLPPVFALVHESEAAAIDRYRVAEAGAVQNRRRPESVAKTIVALEAAELFNYAGEHPPILAGVAAAFAVLAVAAWLIRGDVAGAPAWILAVWIAVVSLLTAGMVLARRSIGSLGPWHIADHLEAMGAWRHGALTTVLDPPAAGGPADLARGVARMARWLEDLSRHRVARLKPAAFAEYIALTGRHAAENAAAPPPAAASAVTRLLSRGFLFTVLAVREQAASSPPGIGRHLRRMRHLAHLHGLAPATETVDRAALRRLSLDLSDPDVHRIVQHALRSSVDGLGTGRRPVIDELAVQIASLVAGIALAAMAAYRAGRDRIDAGSLTTGITAAAQLAHADSGALGALLPSLAGGVDALRLLEGWLRPRAAR